MKDFYTIYNMEADDFAAPLSPKKPTWIIWLKIIVVFFVITIVVFLISNYQSIKKKVLDRSQGLEVLEIKDEDLDGIDDEWEKKNGLESRNQKDATEDLDGDSLNNRREFYFGTNPRKADSDKDGFFDNEEIVKGFNPFGVGRVDSDKDGIYDWWENLFGLNKKDPNDAKKDFDADELNNLDEFKYRTHPKVSDSDRDGIPDGIEVKNKSNPAGTGEIKDALWFKMPDDLDRDGLEIAHEVFFGTDQSKSDSDSDGVNDLEELLKGSNPKGDGKISVQVKIPSIDVDLPVAWMDDKSKESFLKGMGQGAILYPDTAFPATRGNSYIFGSSGSYKYEGKVIPGEFERLSELKLEDPIIITVDFGGGDIKRIIYKVGFTEEVSPNDLRIARDYEGHELTLGTTWPPGADRKIFMVKALIDNPRFR